MCSGSSRCGEKLMVASLITSPPSRARKTLMMLLFSYSVAAASEQVEAARGVISRVLSTSPLASSLLGAFDLELIGDGTVRAPFKDTFEVSTSTEASVTTVHLRGTTGVALASSFYHYLRYFANGTVTWGQDGSGVQLGALQSGRQPLPAVAGGTVSVRSSSSVRYMYNYCTLSYSLAFASAAEWQFQVDWMALHGINMPLAAVGTEHVLAKTYGPSGFGLTETELLDFFPGAAFLGWNRMSDMDGPWSGPLTAAWRKERAAIGNASYTQMRALGMQPILQGFSGHVPCQLARVLPGIKLAPRQHCAPHATTRRPPAHRHAFRSTSRHAPVMLLRNL